MKNFDTRFNVPKGSHIIDLISLTDVPLNKWIQFEDLKWNHSKVYSHILNHSGDFSKPSNNIAECHIDNHLVWWYYNEDMDVCKIKLLPYKVNTITNTDLKG